MSSRRGVVLGMSLAEVFLLVLFVVLFAWRQAQGDLYDALNKWRSAEAARDDAERVLRIEQDKSRKLTEELKRVKAMMPLGRGKRACVVDGNVIVEISVDRGTHRLTVLTTPPPDLQTDGFIFVPGALLVGERMINAVVGSLWTYSNRNDCRFDHRRSYCTPNDYMAVDRYQERLFPSGSPTVLCR